MANESVTTIEVTDPDGVNAAYAKLTQAICVVQAVRHMAQAHDDDGAMFEVAEALGGAYELLGKCSDKLGYPENCSAAVYKAGICGFKRENTPIFESVVTVYWPPGQKAASGGMSMVGCRLPVG